MLKRRERYLKLLLLCCFCCARSTATRTSCLDESVPNLCCKSTAEPSLYTYVASEGLNGSAYRAKALQNKQYQTRPSTMDTKQASTAHTTGSFIHKQPLACLHSTMSFSPRMWLNAGLRSRFKIPASKSSCVAAEDRLGRQSNAQERLQGLQVTYLRPAIQT